MTKIVCICMKISEKNQIKKKKRRKILSKFNKILEKYKKF